MVGDDDDDNNNNNNNNERPVLSFQSNIEIRQKESNDTTPITSLQPNN
jgi:hypothetical protein